MYVAVRHTLSDTNTAYNYRDIIIFKKYNHIITDCATETQSVYDRGIILVKNTNSVYLSILGMPGDTVKREIQDFIYRRYITNDKTLAQGYFTDHSAKI